MTKFFQKPVRKQFLTVLYCFIALTLCLAFLTYSVFYGMISSKASDYAKATARQFENEISFMLSRIDRVCSNILLDRNIEQLMSSPYTSLTQNYVNRLLASFSSYSIMNQDLIDIALATSDMNWSSYFDGDSLNRIRSSIRDTHGTVCLGLLASPLTANQKSRKNLVFAHNVYGMYDRELYGKYLGCIIITVDLDKSAITMPKDENTSTYCILLDQKNESFAFNCDQKLAESIRSQILDSTNGPEAAYLETPGYLASLAHLEEVGLTLLCATERQPLRQDSARAALNLAAVTGVCLILIFVLFYLILRSMVLPLQKLSHHITGMREKPSAQPPAPLKLSGCAEIISLNDSFYDLLTEQAKLNQDLQTATVNLYETKLGLKQAELDYLRSQINPHFLYNALETVQALAVSHGADDIASATQALSVLFRYNSKGKPTVTLRQELEITRAYLTIQQMRFSDRISVIESIRSDTLEVPVMKLLLQPLVENAVSHGLEPKLGKGTVFIGARLEGENLILSVYDDGIGIPPDKLAEIQTELESDRHTDHPVGHVGLFNVQHRIRLFYGPEYGLKIDSSPDGGTKVNLQIPICSDKKGLENDECASGGR